MIAIINQTINDQKYMEIKIEMNIIITNINTRWKHNANLQFTFRQQKQLHI